MSTELHELLGDGEAAAGAASVHAPEVPESPTVLATDRWTRRAGERLADAWRQALETEPGALADDGAAVAMCNPHVAADAIETLLSSAPRMAERPADPTRAAWWKQLLDMPETTALRQRTVCAPAIAEIAAAELARQYAAYAIEHPEDADPDNESPEQSIARMRSTREAMQQALDAADMAEAAGAGLGVGNGGQADAGRLAKYTRRLRQSHNLAAIMRMAGRFAQKAARLQKQRTQAVGMEITGIELSGDLARTLPMEAALVAGAVPELEPLALLRLAQRRVLSYKRLTREPVAMGPIVVSLDESGSMQGERIAAAKGLALAMASIARAQQRPFALCGWADGPIRVVQGDAGPDAIVEWLEAFWNGGTSLHGPLHTLPTEGWPTARWGQHADHIIITDDDVSLPEPLRDEYRAWATRGNVRTFGIGIGVRKATTLESFCDGGVWTLPSLDLDNPAVDVVLSIGPSAF